LTRPMTRPADNTAAQCPGCGTPDVECGRPVCGRCGSAIDAPHPVLPPLAHGDRVADRYVVEGVRWVWPGVTYYAARLEANPSERVLLAERAASDADPLGDVGL